MRGNVIGTAIQVFGVVRIAWMEILTQGIDVFPQPHFIGFFGRWFVGACAGLGDEKAAGQKQHEENRADAQATAQQALTERARGRGVRFVHDGINEKRWGGFKKSKVLRSKVSNRIAGAIEEVASLKVEGRAYARIHNSSDIRLLDLRPSTFDVLFC